MIIDDDDDDEWNELAYFRTQRHIAPGGKIWGATERDQNRVSPHDQYAWIHLAKWGVSSWGTF